MMANSPKNARAAEFRVDRSDCGLSSRSGCAPGRRRGPAQRRTQRPVRRETLYPLAGVRAQDGSEPELEGLGHPAFRVSDEAKLPRQPDLAEAGERTPVRR